MKKDIYKNLEKRWNILTVSYKNSPFCAFIIIGFTVFPYCTVTLPLHLGVSICSGCLKLRRLTHSTKLLLSGSLYMATFAHTTQMLGRGVQPQQQQKWSAGLNSVYSVVSCGRFQFYNNNNHIIIIATYVLHCTHFSILWIRRRHGAIIIMILLLQILCTRLLYSNKCALRSVCSDVKYTTRI